LYAAFFSFRVCSFSARLFSILRWWLLFFSSLDSESLLESDDSLVLDEDESRFFLLLLLLFDLFFFVSLAARFPLPFGLPRDLCSFFFSSAASLLLSPVEESSDEEELDELADDFPDFFERFLLRSRSTFLSFFVSFPRRRFFVESFLLLEDFFASIPFPPLLAFPLLFFSWSLTKFTFNFKKSSLLPLVSASLSSLSLAELGSSLESESEEDELPFFSSFLPFFSLVPFFPLSVLRALFFVEDSPETFDFLRSFFFVLLLAPLSSSLIPSPLSFSSFSSALSISIGALPFGT
jgi:hypothetical protein